MNLHQLNLWKSLSYESPFQEEEEVSLKDLTIEEDYLYPSLIKLLDENHMDKLCQVDYNVLAHFDPNENAMLKKLVIKIDHPNGNNFNWVMDRYLIVGFLDEGDNVLDVVGIKQSPEYPVNMNPKVKLGVMTYITDMHYPNTRRYLREFLVKKVKEISRLDEEALNIKEEVV